MDCTSWYKDEKNNFSSYPSFHIATRKLSIFYTPSPQQMKLNQTDHGFDFDHDV